MTLNIEYITDAKGRQKSVIIPNRQWNAFLSNYQKIKKKLEMYIKDNNNTKMKKVNILKCQMINMKCLRLKY